MNIRFKILSVCVLACSFSLVGVAQKQVLTLEKALAIAQKQSPEIMTSKLNLVRSRKNLEAQNASLKSNFSLNLTPIDFSKDRSFDQNFSFWNTRENTRTFGSFNVSQPIKLTDAVLTLSNRLSWRNSSTSNPIGDKKFSTYSNNLYIQLKQPLFTYNRRKMQMRELELTLEDTQLSYTIQSLNLEKNVTQSFYSLYQSQVALQIAEEEYKNQQLSFEITKNKVEADLIPREELYQAELNLTTSELSVNSKKVSLENTKDAFKQTLGISLYDDIEVRYSNTFQPVLVNMEFAIKHGLEKRNELRQKKIDIEQSQFDLIKTNARNEFKGDLAISMGIFGDNESFDNIYNSPTQNPKISVSLTIPLWDWGEKKARMAAVRASVQTREIALDQQKNNIIRSIRETYRRVLNLETQVSIAEKNVTNAQLTYEINLERYKSGDLTSIDLNRYQNQLSTKKNDLSNARTNYKLELLNLKIQTLWDFEKNISLVP